MNSQAERFKDKCPGCGNWGKGHIIDIVTEKPLCTVKLIEEANLADIVKEMSQTDEGRVAPWRICAENYFERPKQSFWSRLFGKSKVTKHFCPMCGKRVKTNAAFCDVECAIKYMEDKTDDREDKPLQDG